MEWEKNCRHIKFFMLHGFLPHHVKTMMVNQTTSPCEMEPVCLTPESDPIPGIEFDQSRERQHPVKYLLKLFAVKNNREFY